MKQFFLLLACALAIVSCGKHEGRSNDSKGRLLDEIKKGYGGTNVVVALEKTSTMANIKSTLTIDASGAFYFKDSYEGSGNGALSLVELSSLVEKFFDSGFFSLNQAELERQNLTYGGVTDGEITALAVILPGAANKISIYGLDVLYREHPDSQELRTIVECTFLINGVKAKLKTAAASDVAK